MTVYKISKYGNKVEPIEVARVNDKSVWFTSSRQQGERRESRFSEYGSYFDTIGEARSALKERLQGRVDSYREQLIIAKKLLDEFMKSVEPNR